MIFVYDKNENFLATLDVVYKFTREIGKFNTLEFSSDMELEKNSRIIIKKDGNFLEYIVTDIEYEREENYIFSYFCQDSLIEISGNAILDKRPNGDFLDHLEIALKGTRFSLKNSGDYQRGTKKTMVLYHMNSLEAFVKIIEVFGVEWRTEVKMSKGVVLERNLVIGKIGKESHGRLEFGKNIQKFQRKILPTKIITALYGYGKGEEKQDEDGKVTGGYGRRINFSTLNDGKEYVEDKKALEIWGIGKKGKKRHVYGFFVDENIEDKEKLLQATKEELKRRSQLEAEYTVEAANLFIDCKLGDTVVAIDDTIQFRNRLRIIKEVQKGEDIEFTFGYMKKSFTDSIKEEVRKETEETTREVVSIFNEKLSLIKKKYISEDGYTYNLETENEYGLPAGIYSFDKPINENPLKVVYMGAGKVLIANRKSTDGEWEWRTAMTGDGLVGSEIIAHSITANQLAADIGQSLDLSSNVSIDLKVKKGVEEKLSEIKMDDEGITERVTKSIENYISSSGNLIEKGKIKEVVTEQAQNNSKTIAPTEGWRKVEYEGA